MFSSMLGMMMVIQMATPATTEDQGEIVAHVRTIFDAFIAGDADRIRELHSHDWVGFMGPSKSIERGIDQYMQHARSSLESFDGVGYEIIDHEVRVHGDLATIFYTARYDYRRDGQVHSIPLRALDIYERRAGSWIQTGSHIGVIPDHQGWVADNGN